MIKAHLIQVKADNLTYFLSVPRRQKRQSGLLGPSHGPKPEGFCMNDPGLKSPRYIGCIANQRHRLRCRRRMTMQREFGPPDKQAQWTPVSVFFFSSTTATLMWICTHQYRWDYASVQQSVFRFKQCPSVSSETTRLRLKIPMLEFHEYKVALIPEYTSVAQLVKWYDWWFVGAWTFGCDRRTRSRNTPLCT